MFLRNYWYVAAYDHEIGRKPLERQRDLIITLNTNKAAVPVREPLR